MNYVVRQHASSKDRVQAIKNGTVTSDIKSYTTETAINGRKLCKELWLYIKYLTLKSSELYTQ
jgi:hypothetical protein